MMTRTLLMLVTVLLGAEAAAAQDRTTATACDTLLAARRMDAASAPGQPSDEPGCRSVDRKSIGSVEQRALIGGAPYECMTIAGAGRCLWIVP
ncbi:hypothetical protein MKK88_19990 [Methylobacterium sp. E-005]|uniref:hypothetical protein n=1 Tax=Methylobacterium sp. E-005 TaxID=2836549 RepID=UPI001FB9DD6F|nr:hypothetical protein [Methylobacterium sp. E-005]MCJ2088246.1 hypothetical protein [Methylobacterium sp. E-005]